MSLSELFIKRPIMTTLVMAAILIFGIFAYQLLPVSDLPNVDFPTILVSASLPGASPDTMASSVATPLEKQFSTIAGIDSMTSTNSLGQTNITIQFNLSRSLDGAALDVQAAITAAGGQLPPEMPTPPTFQKVNPADSPILYLALSSPTMKLSDVDEAAETTIAQNVSMVNGVAQVQVYGAQKYAMRAQLDPSALASRQIGIDEVSAALQSGNTNLPTGTLYGQNHTFTILSNGQRMNALQFGPMVVAYRNGSPVRLNELGRVIDSVQNDKTASWFNGVRAIVLAIQKQPGTNTVAVVDSIKKLLPRLEEHIPAAVRIDTLYDRSVSIRASVNDVKFTLLLTIALVIMVIFVFLRNVSATIIPSLALPMSIIGTFSVMYLLGYSLDNLSLMALTLSVGFVVDDAIVMLENIVRHMEMGKKPLQAAMDGAGEIGFTILSMTLSLAAVFIPLLFMGGIIGRLLHEFAVTIGAAILVSGFVSLTLTPMLCSRFLRHQERVGPRTAVQFQRARLRCLVAWLRPQPEGSLAAQVRNPDGVFRCDRTDILSVHDLQDRIHSGRRSRPGLRIYRSATGHCISGHDAVAAEGGGCRALRSQRHEHHVFDRQSHQSGPHVFPLEGQERSRQPHERDGGHSGTSPQGIADSRPECVHADSADHPHRRISDQVAISVHAAIARHDRALPGCAQAGECSPRPSAIAGRYQRPAGEEPAAHRGSRPR